MDVHTFSHHGGGPLELDICYACQGIWFDTHENQQLSPASVNDLFKQLHEHRDVQRNPVAPVMACPRCSSKLEHGYDIVRSGRYADYGDGEAMDAMLARLALPTLGLRFSDDWLVPEASLRALVAKLGEGEHRDELFDAARLGAAPDHFRWMRQPEAPAAAIASWIRLSP